jgi:Trk K+ transport system NAD-binding subunit
LKIIVCGLESIARHILTKLKDVDITVITEHQLQMSGVNTISAKNIDKDVLDRAGIKEADVLIVCTENDVSNAFITLLAKSLNKYIRVIAVAHKTETIDNLYKAGANDVLPESVMVAGNLVKQAVTPKIADFIERITISKEMSIAGIKVSSASRVIGKPLKETGIREYTDITILCIKRGEEMIPNPLPTLKIQKDDVLIFLSNHTKIEKLKEYIKG